MPRPASWASSSPGSASATRSTRSSPARSSTSAPSGSRTSSSFGSCQHAIPQFNAPADRRGRCALPFLSDLPVIGPILFSSSPYVYVMYILVIVLTYMLFRTRWGLRLRASGEKPAAAGTVGINVIAIRYRALLLRRPDLRARRVVPVAGDRRAASSMEMTAGKGFIALAAMIFGAWHPVGAFWRPRSCSGSPARPRRSSSVLGRRRPAADPQQHPVRRHDRRRGRRRRTRPRARRGRPAVRAGLAT